MSFAPFEPLRGSPQHRASSVPTYPEVMAVPDDADVEQVHGVAGKHEVKKPVSRPVLHRWVLIRMVDMPSHSATAITVRRYIPVETIHGMSHKITDSFISPLTEHQVT